MMGRRLGSGLAFWLVALTSSSVVAQSPVGFRFETGEAGASLLDSRVDALRHTPRQEQTWREWVRLRMSMFLFDPRFINLVGDVRPTRSQSVFRAEEESRVDGQGLQGSATLSLLSSRSIRTTLRGARSESSISGRFGENFELRQESWGATIRDVDPIFPTEIFYEDRIRDVRRLPLAGLRSNRSGERTRTFRFSVVNRKTGIRLERVQYEQRYTGSEFIRRRGSFGHQIRWGKGSNLQTQFALADRSGLVPFRQFSWTERARLRHYSWLRSEYEYNLRRQNNGQEFRGGRTRLSWQPSETLQLDLTGLMQSSASQLIRQRYAHVFPSARLGLQLPWGTRLSSMVSVGYEWHSQDAQEDVYFDVLQESHTVGNSGQFRLDKPFADPGSLVVGSADGRELFQEGIDFRLAASGPFVDVFILPGSRIAEDDVLVVDYRVRADPTAEGNAWTRSMDVRLTRGPVSAYHRRYIQESLSDLPPGTLPVLREWDRGVTGVNVNWSWRVFSFGAFAEHSRERTDLFDLTGKRVGGSAGARLGRISVSGSSNRTRSEDVRAGATHTVILSQATADWRISQSLRLGVFWTQWSMESNTYDESVSGGGGNLEWRLGRTALDLRYDRIRRVDGTDRTENRLFVRLKRGFRL